MNLLSYVIAWRHLRWAVACCDIFCMPLDIVFVQSWNGANGVQIYL